MNHRTLSIFVASLALFNFAPSWAIADDSGKHKANRFTATSGLFSIDLTAASISAPTPREKVVRPGITSVVYLDGDSNFKVAIVSTKIRDDYPQDDRVIDRQKPRFEQMQRSLGDAFAMTDKTADGKRALTYTLDGETYEETIFPFGFTRGPETSGEFTIGAHRYIVRNGYFIEIACVLTTEASDADERRAAVLSRLDQFVESLDFVSDGE